MRFSAQGMWGRGNYFAVNASYSASYAHTLSNGSKQFFFSQVIVGDAHDCPSDPSLTKPPEKGSSNSNFQRERYDSVSGTTGGSKVFILYTNGRAFPSYLVTFK